MSAIPHDYYLKFTERTVLSDVIEFHSKGNYSLHKAFNDMSYLHNINTINLEILTGKEINLYPDMHLSIPLSDPLNVQPHFVRYESFDNFTDTQIPFSKIEELICPLLHTRKDTYKRGYPSGGALYPIETFICALGDPPDDWPCAERVLHLLPTSRTFERVQNTLNSDILKKSILPIASTIGTPNLAIIYVAYLPKTLFKYRYRGYRLALMEAGSIYMLIELCAKSLALRCRLWTGFTDTMLCKALGLNPAIFSPLCVHFIGKEK